MNLKSLLGLNCDEAATACSKAQYKEASLREKLKLRLHLFFCKPCKEYSKKNQKLSLLIKKAKIQTCSEVEKEAYRQRMNNAGSHASKG